MKNFVNAINKNSFFEQEVFSILKLNQWGQIERRNFGRPANMRPFDRCSFHFEDEESKKKCLGESSRSVTKKSLKSLLPAYKAVGWNMLVKINFLYSHSNFFRKILMVYQMSMVKEFTRIYCTLKKAIMGNGHQRCLQVSIGLSEKLQLKQWRGRNHKITWVLFILIRKI